MFYRDDQQGFDKRNSTTLTLTWNVLLEVIVHACVVTELQGMYY